MMKLALMRTTTGMEDTVTSSAEDKFFRVTSLINCSPNKCFRVQVTDTSQHQLFRGDCVVVVVFVVVVVVVVATVCC